MSRREHFQESAGDPILGYDTGEEVVCRNCGKDDPEYALVDPKKVNAIKFSDLGAGYGAYSDGFTCAGCGETLGDWDYKGRR